MDCLDAAEMKIGLGGAVILLVLSLATGQNFFALLEPATGPGSSYSTGPGSPHPKSATEEELVDFVSFVLDDVQSTWTDEFPKIGKSYRDAKLVLFTDTVRSGCGFAEAASPRRAPRAAIARASARPLRPCRGGDPRGGNNRHETVLIPLLI
jgi:predicted metalloprotease